MTYTRKLKRYCKRTFTVNWSC